MRKKLLVRAVAALAGGGVLAAAGTAGAVTQQTCTANGNTIGDANTVFVTGSSAIEPLLQHLAYVLYEEAAAASEAGTPSLSQVVKIVYQSTASCQGANDITTAMAESASAKYMDGSNAPNGVAKEYACTGLSGPGSTLVIDIGASDVFPASCGIAVPAGMKDFYQGAIQVMEFAVPTASSENSITADAGYVVMGWGGETYQVGPWTDYTQIWIRPNGFLASGTETMIGGAIGLVTTKWLSAVGNAGAGQVQQGSGGVYNHLVASTKPNATLGILSAEFLDENRGAPVTSDAGVVTAGGVKPLAFQAAGQDCAYYADSSANTFDKMNVRQGRYAIWGAHHWVTNVDGSGNPVGLNGNSAAVAGVIAHLMHASTLPPLYDQQMIVAEAKTFDVPGCAMEVSRTREVDTMGSGEMSYLPPKGCGCYYESLINNGTPISSYCKPCGGDAGTCSAPYPACNYGFCEVQ